MCGVSRKERMEVHKFSGIVIISDMFDSGFRAFLCLEVITFMTNKIYFDIPYKIVLKKWGRLK